MKKIRKQYVVVGVDKARGKDHSAVVVGRMCGREFVVVEEVQHDFRKAGGKVHAR